MLVKVCLVILDTVIRDFPLAKPIHGIRLSPMCSSSAAPLSIAETNFLAASFPTISALLPLSPIESPPIMLSPIPHMVIPLPGHRESDTSISISGSGYPLSESKSLAELACLSATCLGSLPQWLLPSIRLRVPNFSFFISFSSSTGFVLKYTIPPPFG